MLVQDITTYSWTKDHHTSQYLCVNLGDTDARDYHLELFWQEICSKEKMDEIFKDLPNVFVITDDILVVGYDRDGKDHDGTLKRVLQIFIQVNLKLNKDKCHFRCTQVLFLGKILSKNDVKSDPWKLKAMTEMPPSKTKKDSKHYLE